MPIPTNKEELIAAITVHYEKLRADLLLIPSSTCRQKKLEGHTKGTTMSICDLVGYLNGWGKLALTWIKKRDAGDAVDFPETGYKWNELGKLAQKFYSDHEHEVYEDLLDDLDSTVHAILAVIAKKTNKELYGTNWYENYTLGRMIQLNTSSPYQNARARLRKLKTKKA